MTRGAYALPKTVPLPVLILLRNLYLYLNFSLILTSHRSLLFYSLP